LREKEKGKRLSVATSCFDGRKEKKEEGGENKKMFEDPSTLGMPQEGGKKKEKGNHCLVAKGAICGGRGGEGRN